MALVDLRRQAEADAGDLRAVAHLLDQPLDPVEQRALAAQVGRLLPAGTELEARSDERGLDGGAAEVDADDGQRGGIGHGGG